MHISFITIKFYEILLSGFRGVGIIDGRVKYSILSSTRNQPHLQGPVTLASVTERLAVELSLPVLTTGLSRPGIESRSPASEANALLLNHRSGV